MHLLPRSQYIHTQEPSCGKPLTGQQDTQRNLSTASIHENPTNAGNSLRSRLPLELRRKIYSYALGAPEINCLIILPSNELLAVRETYAQTRHVIVDTWSKFSYKRQFWTFFDPDRLALLRTCRQVYTEAVDIFYQVNTFVIKHPYVLERFACTVRYQQFNQIRHLDISVTVFARAWMSSCEGHFFGRRGWDTFWLCSCNGEFHRQQWEAMWSTIIGMRNLQMLNVDVDYRRPSYFRAIGVCQLIDDHVEDGRQVLQPLLALRGLKEFTLDLKVRYESMESCLCYPVTAETEALMEFIGETATQPRIEPGRMLVVNDHAFAAHDGHDQED
ncbi:MAG: hypothetical protein Q9209_005437 [Squamulea sp. 1 TL-2023]